MKRLMSSSVWIPVLALAIGLLAQACLWLDD